MATDAALAVIAALWPQRHDPQLRINLRRAINVARRHREMGW